MDGYDTYCTSMHKFNANVAISIIILSSATFGAEITKPDPQKQAVPPLLSQLARLRHVQLGRGFPRDVRTEPRSRRQPEGQLLVTPVFS